MGLNNRKGTLMMQKKGELLLEQCPLVKNYYTMKELDRSRQSASIEIEVKVDYVGLDIGGGQYRSGN